jgi:hypothetical protein
METPENSDDGTELTTPKKNNFSIHQSEKKRYSDYYMDFTVSEPSKVNLINL